MSNKKPEAGRLPYTKVSLILDFLRGSLRYFFRTVRDGTGYALTPADTDHR